MKSSDGSVEQRLYAAADEALATGKPVEVDDLMVVPDIRILEGLSNGLEPPPATWRLERPDGRSVSVYRIPRPPVKAT